ncbi:hypothetical protein CYMTET_7769 [Cymbomonas tetramitiformis]|uniref:Uncharacterized protein n=1 Tax=Cymbomonas tetramitiformis TaxID=36881 RepID=A0AAE0GV04_9CHLO|nr:hypothetical protein CYMTET_7769 [Cymbomonas tetramitiformis]
MLTLQSPTFAPVASRNWAEASGFDAPADGKRATLEVVHALDVRSSPFEPMSERMPVCIPVDVDPDEGIRLFNNCLRDAQRLQTLPEDVVKRQFLSTLFADTYSWLIDSFARADQRVVVSLLTLQARVREQFRHGRLSYARLKHTASRAPALHHVSINGFVLG